MKKTKLEIGTVDTQASFAGYTVSYPHLLEVVKRFTDERPTKTAIVNALGLGNEPNRKVIRKLITVMLLELHNAKLVRIIPVYEGRTYICNSYEAIVKEIV